MAGRNIAWSAVLRMVAYQQGMQENAGHPEQPINLI